MQDFSKVQMVDASKAHYEGEFKIHLKYINGGIYRSALDPIPYLNLFKQN
jgi:hypothetical protein